MTNTQILKNIMASNIKVYLSQRGITQTDLARELGYPEMTVSNWVKAKTYPRIDRIQEMADYFNIARSNLTEAKPTNLELKAAETVKVPVIGEIACGAPAFAMENFTDYRMKSPQNLPGGDVVILIAKGDSMYPTIPDKAEVLIRMQDDVESGEIAAVLINGDTEATLKRIKKQGDVVMLVPDNSNYPPLIGDKDNPIRIIGKAIKFTSHL